MRVAILAASLMLAAAPLRAQAPELDEAIMENVDVVNESLASNLGLQDAAASATDAEDLGNLLTEVEAYFVRRGDAPDAVGYARTSREAAQRIVVEVKGSRFDTAAQLGIEISRTCKTCHRKYKPDK